MIDGYRWRLMARRKRIALIAIAALFVVGILAGLATTYGTSP